jgi:prevent-host-death family protein
MPFQDNQPALTKYTEGINITTQQSNRRYAMSSTTMSCTALNRNIGKAKKAARTGPVIITNRGQPAYVLMNIAQYQQVTGNGKNIVDLLAMPGAEDIDFNPPRLFATPPSHS